MTTLYNEGGICDIDFSLDTEEPEPSNDGELQLEFPKFMTTWQECGLVRSIVFWLGVFFITWLVVYIIRRFLLKIGIILISSAQAGVLTPFALFVLSIGYTGVKNGGDFNPNDLPRALGALASLGTAALVAGVCVAVQLLITGHVDHFPDASESTVLSEVRRRCSPPRRSRRLARRQELVLGCGRHSRRGGLRRRRHEGRRDGAGATQEKARPASSGGGAEPDRIRAGEPRPAGDEALAPRLDAPRVDRLPMMAPCRKRG